jgi:F-type H+-transporting ATPase subunit epsilon
MAPRVTNEKADSMATFHFDLVSPEKLLFSGEVTQVNVPGEEGDFGVLAGHAPYVATLRPGILTILGGGPEQNIVVTGGFAEVSPAGMTVLADFAMPVENFDQTRLAAEITAAEEVRATAQGAAHDKASERVAQLQALEAQLGQ